MVFGKLLRTLQRVEVAGKLHDCTNGSTVFQSVSKCSPHFGQHADFACLCPFSSPMNLFAPALCIAMVVTLATRDVYDIV